MSFYFRISIVFFMSVLITGCQTTLPKGVTPVKATWLYGYHTIPAKFTRSDSEKSWRRSHDWMKSAAKEVKPGIKVPVVLYLHGCAGIRDEDLSYRDFMLEQGYAVFMPDSFARDRQECSAQGKLWERIDMRSIEVINAVKELKKLPWVDQEHIILMGFSEGGNTTDNWSRSGFKAHIILGSACTLIATGTPNAPENVPVLAIVGEQDDYRPGQTCSITRTIGGSRSVVIPNADHWVANYTQTRYAIKNFLNQCCR